VVEHLLAAEHCDASGCDQAAIAAAIAAERRLREFPDDVQRAALLRGLEHDEGRVRTASASYLLHCDDPLVTEAMRRHLSDPEPGVTMRAKTHVRLYGETPE